MVVGLEVQHQRGFQLGCRGKPSLLYDLADAAIKALHHTVGLRVARRAQAVRAAQQCALLVKRMAARGLALLGRKAVCELAAVVGQHSFDFHRRSALETAQKVAAAELALVTIDAHIDPARGAVDGDKQFAKPSMNEAA